MERGQGRGRGRRRRGKPGEEESAELKSGAENRGRVAGRAERQRSAGVSNGGKAGVGGPGGRRGRGAVVSAAQGRTVPAAASRAGQQEGGSLGRAVGFRGGRGEQLQGTRGRRTGRRGEGREPFWGSTSLPKPPRSQAPRASPSSQIPVLGPWTQIPWKTTHAPQTSAAAAAPTRLVRLALPCEGGGFWSPAHLAPLARSAPAAPPPAVLGSRRRRTTSVREGAGGA